MFKLKKIVKYTDVLQGKSTVSSREKKREDTVNKSLILMRHKNLALRKGDAKFKQTVIDYNNYLRKKDIKAITKLIKKLLQS